MIVAPGVRVGVTAAPAVAYLVVTRVYGVRGYPVIQTSGREGRHTRGSLHYAERAWDFRTKHVPESERLALRDEIAQALGEDFDVILEAEPPHLHVEFDPKLPLSL